MKKKEIKGTIRENRFLFLFSTDLQKSFSVCTFMYPYVQIYIVRSYIQTQIIKLTYRPLNLKTYQRRVTTLDTRLNYPKL